MRIKALLFVCAVLAVAPGARAERVAEPATGVQFDARKSVDGRNYTLIGAGVRKKVFAKVYAMGLYVEDVDGKRAFPSLATKAGGTDKAKLTEGDRAQSFVMWGAFNKIAVLHFVRDVDAGKIRGAFEEGLTDELAAKAPADVREATQAFLNLIDKDAKSGDEIVLHTAPDGMVDISIGGDNKGSVQNVKLARKIWAVWLGARPISKDLRQDLVNRIDELGK
jgi:hypothetical protein